MAGSAVRQCKSCLLQIQGMIAACLSGARMRTSRVDGESGGGAGGRLYTRPVGRGIGSGDGEPLGAGAGCGVDCSMGGSDARL